MTDEPRIPSQLYLLLPKALNQGVVKTLQNILENTQIACVLVQKSDDGGFDTELVNMVIGIVQGHNVACLVDDDWELALKLGADGVHLSSGLEAGDATEEETIRFAPYDKARAALGEDAIIGGLCYNRHVALTFGEQGAQYVALPSEHEEDSDLTAHEQIQWWVELIELPCVAWDIKDINEVDQFIENGADFLALGELVWNHDDPVNMIREISEKL
ncbi:MAG: thiamine phosphate synthase [Methyloligellaceae bacterium]